MIVLAALVAAAPTVAADDATGEDVRSWTRAILHTSNNGTLPLDETVALEPPHGLNVTRSEAAFRVTGYVALGSGTLATRTGDIVFTATVDDEDPVACNQHYNVPPSEDTQAAAVNIWCQAPPVTAGSTVRLQAQVQTATGADPVDAWAFSFSWTQNDVIDMQVELSTALDAWIPFLFWGTLAIVMFARSAFAPGFGAALMFANEVLEEPILSFQFGLLLFAILLVVHVVAVNGFFPGFGKGRDPE